MSSFKKLQTAGLNGSRLSRPVPAAGAAISSLNAIRNNLTAKTIVLSNEARERFKTFYEEYLHEFQPQTAAEKDAVEEMVVSKWRQRRVWGVETALLDLQMDRQAKQIGAEFDNIDEMTRLALAIQDLGGDAGALQTLKRYYHGLRADYDRAFQRLMDLRILNAPETSPEKKS